MPLAGLDWFTSGAACTLTWLSEEATAGVSAAQTMPHSNSHASHPLNCFCKVVPPPY